MGIMIRWREAREFIALDLAGLEGHKPIRTTREVWDDGTVVTYRTTSKFEKKGESSWELTLVYDRSKNLHVPDGATFGTSRITLAAGATTGKATWEDDSDPNRNGTRYWKVLDGTIMKKNTAIQRMIRKVERQQHAFRLKLKGVYGKCAITKEESLAALEAAHIVPARDGGAGEIGNGLLLRADLHRLYDAREFSIDATGKVVMPSDSTLSPKYKTLLQNKSIPDDVLRNVESALRHKLANKARA